MGNCLPLMAMACSLGIIERQQEGHCAGSGDGSKQATEEIEVDSSSSISAASEAPPPSRSFPSWPSRRILSELYTIGPVLGQGQSSVTRLVTCLATGASYACKSIPKSDNRRRLEEIKREVRITRRLSAASIGGDYARIGGAAPNQSGFLLLHQVLEDHAFVHLILELCRGGELFHRILQHKRLPERLSATIMQRLLLALHVCHSHGIIHRDLKPENILFLDDSESSTIKLIDFGLALEFSPGQKFSDIAGSSYYIAPEVLQGQYSQEIDLWSAGIILYILLSGEPPFWGPTDQLILKSINRGHLDLSSEPWNHISSAAKHLITGLLQPAAHKRLTPLQALNHPWILHHTKQAHLSLPRSPPPPPLVANFLTPSSDCNPRNLHPLPPPESPELDQILAAVCSRIMHVDSSQPSSWDCLADLCTTATGAADFSCTLLTVTATEQTLLMELGQRQYMIVHDKKRGRVGCKMLAAKYFRRDGNSKKSVICV